MQQLTVVVRGYDSLFPLSRGAVASPGVQIRLDHRTSIDRMAGSQPPPAGEISLSRYLLGVAAGDDRWVGLPVWLIRGFRHRSFWVRTDSALTSLSQLDGARVGLSGWADTGNTWSRALLADSGVDLDRVRWRLGPPQAGYSRRVAMPGGARPDDLELLADGDNLTDAAIDGRLDAVSLAFPPDDLFRPDAPLRRLVADWQAAERAWFTRTGIYPVFHTLAIRRDIFTARPDVAADLYHAVADSWRSAHALYRTFGDTTPWLQAEIEDAYRLLGPAAAPFGLTCQVHRDSITALAHAQLLQRLATVEASLDDAFGEVLPLLDEAARPSVTTSLLP
jgi:4,5-dihydroxyphthalate decarboxylase